MTKDTSSPITIEDIRKLTLPISAQVITGDGLLNQPVVWATLIYPDEKLFHKEIQPNELILIGKKNHSKSQTSDSEIIHWATEKKVTCLVTQIPFSPTALAEAKAQNLPILLLPPNTRIREVEKSIISLLVNRKGQIERRGTQIYRQLTQISTQNEGIDEIISAMARLTNKAVILQDKRLNIISDKIQPQLISIWDDIEQFLRKSNNLPVELSDRHRVSEIDSPVLMQALPTPGMARLVAPVITQHIGRGYLSIVGYDNDLDEIDALVTEHGAEACALEMAKQKAVSETEKRLRGTFLDRLLLGDVSQQEAIRQGERFNHDMTQNHMAMVLSWRGKEKESPSMRRLETLVNTIIGNQNAGALVWIREKEKEVVVFHATDPENPIDYSLELANAFTSDINRQFPQNRVALGLGQVARDINSWRTSYRDAKQAMELAVRLQTDDPLYIGDLGVYQLILGLKDREKLSEFCDNILGTLSKYDERQNADLIKTLEAFFNAHGNLSQTAEALIVHRNTLLYRMNRINEIAGIDLNRPETRLALHLALTIRRLLALN